jgi:hypothetical protein
MIPLTYVQTNTPVRYVLCPHVPILKRTNPVQTLIHVPLFLILSRLRHCNNNRVQNPRSNSGPDLLTSWCLFSCSRNSSHSFDLSHGHKRYLANNSGGGGVQNWPWVLGALFYKGVKFGRGENWSHKTHIFNFLFSVYFWFDSIQ